MEESEQHIETHKELTTENEDNKLNKSDIEIGEEKNYSEEITKDQFFERKEESEEKQLEQIPTWILEADEKVKTTNVTISNHVQIMSLIENIEKEIQLIKRIIKEDKKIEKIANDKSLRKISAIENSRSGRKR